MELRELRRKGRLACGCAAIALGLAFCVSKSGDGGQPAVVSIAIVPGAASVAASGTQQFQVIPSVTVIWGIAETADIPSPAFPLRSGATGRYLVDRDGVPFFLVGDAAQSAAGALSYEQFTAYVDDRVSRGFNAVNINFLEHRYAPNPPADRDGNAPFAVPGDFSTADDAYFAGVERKLAYAESKGVYVLLAFYMGLGDHAEGWYREVEGNSAASCHAFGQYLATGHGSFPGFGKHANVAWVWGADWLFTTDTAVRDQLHEVARGVRELAPAQLMTGDWGIGVATQQSGFETYMDLQNTYDYAAVVDTARHGYQYAPAQAAGDGRALAALPQFLKETAYEAERNAPGGTPAAVRSAHWWAILSGATTGLVYGHRDVWPFAFATPGYAPCLFPACTEYTASLAAPGAQDMGRLAALMRTIAWHALVPSGTSSPFVGRTLIRDGQDTADGGTIAAAQTSDGTLLVAYSPSSTSFKVDVRGMNVPMRVRWWNPVTGAYVAPGPSFDPATTYSLQDQVYDQGAWYRSLAPSNAGHVPSASPAQWEAVTTPTKAGDLHLRMPGDNGSGATDWLLVIDAATPRCGTISSSGLFTAPPSPPHAVRCEVTATVDGASTVTARAQLDLR